MTLVIAAFPGAKTVMLLVIAWFFVGRRLSTAQEAWKRWRHANGLPMWW